MALNDLPDRLQLRLAFTGAFLHILKWKNFPLRLESPCDIVPSQPILRALLEWRTGRQRARAAATWPQVPLCGADEHRFRSASQRGIARNLNDNRPDVFEPLMLIQIPEQVGRGAGAEALEVTAIDDPRCRPSRAQRSSGCRKGNRGVVDRRADPKILGLFYQIVNVTGIGEDLPLDPEIAGDDASAGCDVGPSQSAAPDASNLLALQRRHS